MIHMHDLQVQNNIVSKNSIEATNKITSNNIETNNLIVNQQLKGPLTDKNVHRLEVIDNLIVTGSIQANNNIIAKKSMSANQIYSNDILMQDQQKQTKLRIGYTTDTLTQDMYGYLLAGQEEENNKEAQFFGLRIKGTKLSLVNSEGEEYTLTWNGSTLIPSGDISCNILYASEAQFDGDVSIIGELNNGNNVYLHDGSINTTIREEATGQWSITSANSLTAQALSADVGNVGGEDIPVYFKDGVPIQCKQIIPAEEIGTTVPNIYGGGATGSWNINSQSSYKLIDDNNNNLSVGTAHEPVYFFNGIPMVCSYVALAGEAAFADVAGEAQWADAADTADTANKLVVESNPYLDPPINPQNQQIFFKIDPNGSKIQVDDGDWAPVIPYIYIPR